MLLKQHSPRNISPKLALKKWKLQDPTINAGGDGGVGAKSLDNELYYNAMAVWLYFHFQMWCELPAKQEKQTNERNDSLAR